MILIRLSPEESLLIRDESCNSVYNLLKVARGIEQKGCVHERERLARARTNINTCRHK